MNFTNQSDIVRDGIIMNADLLVEKTDSYKGKTIINSRIDCLFNLRPDEFNHNNASLICSADECYSEDFRRVFEGCVIEGCIINGVDT